MRLHNFFIKDPVGDASVVTVKDANLIHQWGKVFRMHEGDTIVLFDGSGYEFVATFSILAKGHVELAIVEKRKGQNIPIREICLYQSIAKKDTFEWIVEKATELGVTRIVPIISSRSEKKGVNMERLLKIAMEASEQSGRCVLPRIMEPTELSGALSTVPLPAIAFHASAERFERDKDAQGNCSIFIGPEGGWSEHELSMFADKGIALRSVGTQTLRAETAAVAVLALTLLGR